MTIFEKIERNKIDLSGFSDEQKITLSWLMKAAFNDGIDHQKQEQNKALLELNQSINLYLENNL